MKNFGRVLTVLISLSTAASFADGISREYRALGLELHSESTSFEALVQQRQKVSRGPASAGGRFRVISVRRELGLTKRAADAAPIDIIINAGDEQGLDPGTVLRVFRKISVIDPYQDNLQREIDIPFAIVKIKHADSGIAVARVEKMDTIASGISLGVRGVLIGDYVGFQE
jgi:hypothetical protein